MFRGDLKEKPKESKAAPEEQATPDTVSAVQTATDVRSTHKHIRKTTYIETFIHLFKGFIGAGVFAMGGAFKNSGLIFGLIMTYVLGIICAYNSHLLIKCSQHVKDHLHLETLPNFPETVQLSLQNGSECIRRHTTFVKRFVTFAIFVTQLGFCSIYLLFVAKTVQNIVKEHTGFHKDKRIFVLIVSLPIVMTALITSLKFLTPISFIADISLAFGIIAVIYKCSESGYPPLSERPAIASWTTWAMFFGTTIFAFEGISLVVPLRNEMKNPRLFGVSYGVLNVGMCFIISFTAFCGFIAYLKFGEDIKDTVTLNFEDDIFSDIIKAAVGLGITFSYAIQFHIAVDVTWWELVRIFSIKRVVIGEYLYRLLLASVTIAVACGVPYLGEVVSLIGSVFGACLALIFPASCDIALRTTTQIDRMKDESKLVEIIRYVMDGVTLFTAVIGLVAGSTTNFISIYEAFKNDPYALN